MSLSVVKLQTRLVMTSANPKDAVVNTWHFLTDGAVAANLDAITAAMNTFYNAVDQYFSTDMAATGHTYKYYDLADPIPRAPIRTQATNTLVMTGATPLPHELAICMSYRTFFASGTPNARRRGRIFLGPLDVTATSLGKISSTVRTAFANAGAALMAAGDATTTPATGVTGWRWVVYSPRADELGANLIGSASAVTGGWVDEAHDVQRKRGIESTQRTLWGSGSS